MDQDVLHRIQHLIRINFRLVFWFIALIGRSRQHSSEAPLVEWSPQSMTYKCRLMSNLTWRYVHRARRREMSTRGVSRLVTFCLRNVRESRETADIFLSYD